MIAYHEVRDEAKVAALAAAIERDGWQGSPLVVVDDINLITGCHRYAAVRSLGWEDAEIPTVELAEVFDGAGLDLETVMADEGCESIDDAAFVYVVNALPAEVRESYGIDLH